MSKIKKGSGIVLRIFFFLFMAVVCFMLAIFAFSELDKDLYYGRPIGTSGSSGIVLLAGAIAAGVIAIAVLILSILGKKYKGANMAVAVIGGIFSVAVIGLLGLFGGLKGKKYLEERDRVEALPPEERDEYEAAVAKEQEVKGRIYPKLFVPALLLTLFGYFFIVFAIISISNNSFARGVFGADGVTIFIIFLILFAVTGMFAFPLAVAHKEKTGKGMILVIMSMVCAVAAYLLCYLVYFVLDLIGDLASTDFFDTPCRFLAKRFGFKLNFSGKDYIGGEASKPSNKDKDAPEHPDVTVTDNSNERTLRFYGYVTATGEVNRVCSVYWRYRDDIDNFWRSYDEGKTFVKERFGQQPYEL